MSFSSFHASAQTDFNPTPSTEGPDRTKIAVAKSVPETAGYVGVPVAVQGDVPKALGLDRAALKAAGFDGKVGQTLIVPRAKGPAFVAVGIGESAELDTTKLRDAAAAFARAADKHPNLAAMIAELGGLKPDLAAQAIVEGIVLARYRFSPLKRKSPQATPLAELTLVTSSTKPDAIEKGIERGGIMARAAELARDLANAPAALLTARRFAEIAQTLAPGCGLEIEIFDDEALSKLGCGGILGVNAGSAEPARMIKLTYHPKNARGEAIEPSARVSLVGKGIMFDSGGISLKPNDLVHATMKGDMSGAGAILAAMSALAALECTTEVTGYLMCTDNMPSATAMKLGDVLTIRNGKTVEVLNTDAEGRLVLADGLVLSTEQQPRPDAIVDIATLTGACQRALGLLCAGVMGNNQQLVDQFKEASDRTDESVWQLPLERRYRKELDSEIADIQNIGSENAGAITAALFLEEFVDGVPWAHLDIAGTARAERDDSWRSKGATGFGARLLADFLTSFTPPQQVH